MKRLKELYSSRNSSRIQYTNRITNRFDANRAIRSLRPWILSMAREIKQKKLIFNDWTFEHWSVSKKSAIKNLLKQLFDEHFTLYYEREGEIIEFLQHDLERSGLGCFHYRESERQYHHPKDLINWAASQYKLSSDDFFVLDDYWLQLVLEEQPIIRPRALNLSDYVKINAKQRKSLIAVMNHSSPKLSLIKQDEFSYDANKALIELKLHVPDLAIETLYDSLTIDQSAFDNLLNEHIYALEGSQLRWEQLSSIKNIVLENVHLTEGQLANLLSTIPYLERISLIDSKIEGPIHCPAGSLPKLKEIEFAKCTLTIDCLQALLHASPNAVKLEITDCNTINGTLNLAVGSLGCLKEIELCDSSLSDESLRILLLATSHLEELSFYGEVNVGCFSSIPKGSLKQLKELTLFGANLSTNGLQKMLRAATNITILNLDECEQFNGELIIPEESLKKLSILELKNCSIQTKHLTKLLLAAPALTTLSLPGCTNIDYNQLFNRLPKELQFIELSDSPLSLGDLNHLLKAAKNLKEIKLSQCINLGGELTIAEDSLPNLISIDLSNTPITTTFLHKLLRAAKNLKKINCSGCTELCSALALSENSLKQLEELYLSFSNISSEGLQSLLRASKNLKTLQLYECERLGKEIDLEEASLIKLEELSLNTSHISAATLQKLLLAANRIKRLELILCSRIRDTLSLPEGSLKHLKQIKLDKGAITSESLQSLLVASKNLQVLDLSFCLNLKSTLELPNKFFASLKEIKMFRTTLNRESLQTLLASTSHLEKLSLLWCSSKDSYLVPEGAFSKLKELQLSLDSQTTDNLAVFLNATSCLKKIILYGCELIKDDLLSEGSLARLEYISLHGKELATDHLHNLLLAAPNLQTLSLSGCEKITGNLNLPEGIFEHLEEIVLSNGIISIRNLESLLASTSSLKTLDLLACTAIREDVLNYLQMNYPNVIIKHSKIQSDSHSGIPSETRSACDPLHDFKKHQQFKPKSKNIPFRYRGNNKNKNQAMVIEQISQYLTLSNQNLELLDEVQDGICMPLAHYFVEKGSELLNKLLNTLYDWEGSSITLELDVQCRQLVPYIQKYRLDVTSQQRVFLGANLPGFLNTLQRPCILNNPWHALGIIPITEDEWIVYDPNFVEGSKTVSDFNLLLSILDDSLGSLISVEFLKPIQPGIPDPQRFLEEGGLLALNQAVNAKEMLAQIPPDLEFTSSALSGLLLRDIQGSPAWAKGLINSDPKVAAFSAHVLRQLIQKNLNYKHVLQKSMEAMTREQKINCFTHIKEWFPSLVTEGIPWMYPTAKEYEQELQTWNKSLGKREALDTYIIKAMAFGDIKKRLIKLESSAEVSGMRFALEAHAKKCKRPVFYVHSPEDLICNAPFIERIGDKGLVRSGHKGGGALYDFLEGNNDNAPVLIVNYDTFTHEDIIRLHDLLNKKRFIDKTLVPAQTLILGLINTSKPDCYSGSDFYGRFDKQETCTVSSEDIKRAIPELPVVSGIRNPDNVINLFHAADWKERLLGKWIAEGNDLHFEDGLLVSALKKPGPIEIQNGLWEEEEFKRFWQEAKFHGRIEYAGAVIPIPEHLELIAHEGYEWTSLIKYLCAGNVPSQHILNPNCFNDWFKHSVFDEQRGSIKSQNGLIEANSGHSLHAYLTRSIGHDEWAMLLSECHRHHVSLNLSVAPGVELPVDWALAQRDYYMNAFVGPRPNLHLPILEHTFLTQVIISSDIDVTVALLNKDREWRIIDASECSPADLLERIDGEFNPNTLRFEYKKTTCALLDGLARNKHIILKGTFSDELRDHLAQLILARQKAGTQVLGKLVLITNNPDSFAYAPGNIVVHQVSVDEKRECLGKLPSELEQSLLMHEPLCTLQARLLFWSTHPYPKNSDNAWRGLHDLSGSVSNLDPFNPQTSVSEARAFIQHRRNIINSKLTHAPFVFLAGLSGVGKSTFVTQQLCQGRDVLYQENKIEDWIKDKSLQGRKLLFIDEATLNVSDWSMFEGLYQDPPRVLYKGILHKLSKEHSVVFAGNPVSYGDERKLAQLFERHGNTVVFEPLPTAVLYEDILKPIFADTLLEKHQENLAAHFLEVYRYLVSCSTKDVLISPRELQTMALLTVSYCKNYPHNNPLSVAQHYAFTLAESLVPEVNRNEFIGRFSAQCLNYGIENMKPNDFLITPSRAPIYQQLKDGLILRRDRIQNSATGNSVQLYGGLGGIIVEGEPGIGKTELVIEALRTSGFEEMNDFERPAISLHSFYRLPVNLDPDKKEALLCKAFNEGAVVIIDEFNSSPIMETLINELLMGTLNGQKPKQPGFMIIGTQNPVNMTGRRMQSTAFLKRVEVFKLSPYTAKEMHDILLSKDVSEGDAIALIDAFTANLEKAKAQHLSPLPSFRDLIRLAEQIKRGAEQKPDEEGATFWNRMEYVSILDSDEGFKKLVPRSSYSKDFVFFPPTFKEVREGGRSFSFQGRISAI
jgi:hypothetical protein